MRRSVFLAFALAAFQGAVIPTSQSFAETTASFQASELPLR